MHKIELTDEQFNYLFDFLNLYNDKKIIDIVQIMSLQIVNCYEYEKKKVPCIRPLIQLIKDMYEINRIEKVDISKKKIVIRYNEFSKLLIPENIKFVKEYSD